MQVDRPQNKKQIIQLLLANLLLSSRAVKGESIAQPFHIASSSSEQVVSHLRYIRQELREMHHGVDGERNFLPERAKCVRGCWRCWSC